MIKISVPASLLLLLVIVPPSFSQTPDRSSPMLYSAAKLRESLQQPHLLIVDVRTQEAYRAAHIPGAVHVDLGDWKSLALAKGGLKNSDAWASRLGALGISNKSQVVLYGGKLSDTARIWWLLKYLGVRNVALLDGGWEWWTKENLPVDQTVPNVQATKFSPRFQNDRLAEFQSVKDSLNTPNINIVDTRSTDEFENGRIADAVHLEWKQLVATDGRFKSPAELRKLFKEKGIQPAETAVCY